METKISHDNFRTRVSRIIWMALKKKMKKIKFVFTAKDRADDESCKIPEKFEKKSWESKNLKDYSINIWTLFFILFCLHCIVAEFTKTFKITIFPLNLNFFFKLCNYKYLNVLEYKSRITLDTNWSNLFAFDVNRGSTYFSLTYTRVYMVCILWF